MSAHEIGLLLVDDQELTRRGMALLLDGEPGLRVVGDAADGAEAVAAVERLRPDVVVMDIRMPGMDGIEATRRIVRGGGSSRVLVLTTFDLDRYAFEALRAGASGFLIKNTPPRELVAAIRTVADGHALISPRVTRALLDVVAPRLPRRGAEATIPELDGLTDREVDVLTAIAQGLSNVEIGQRLSISESTVKTHVGRVLQKLDLRDRVHAVILGYEVGLV